MLEMSNVIMVLIPKVLLMSQRSVENRGSEKRAKRERTQNNFDSTIKSFTRQNGCLCIKLLWNFGDLIK